MDNVHSKIMILSHNFDCGNKCKMKGNMLKKKSKHVRACFHACIHLALPLSSDLLALRCEIVQILLESNVLILCINSMWCAVWTNLLIYDRNRHNLAIIGLDHALIYANFHIACVRSLSLSLARTHSLLSNSILLFIPNKYSMS